MSGSLLSPLPLDHVDLSLTLDDETYEAQLAKRQLRLRKAVENLQRSGRSAIIVYQGWDAAGKGGNIRRLTAMLDPRSYTVVPISAPTDEEQSHHYLWRFWQRLPERGKLTIFDRSWYGRVMVERVEGFCDRQAWGRAYREINEFERQLTESGVILVKFWIHISPEEQLRRFHDRETNPFKRYKITPDDWRNRDKWPQYEIAVNDMLLRTSTAHAPWTILEGESKRWARVRALRVVARAIKQGLR